MSFISVDYLDLACQIYKCALLGVQRSIEHVSGIKCLEFFIEYYPKTLSKEKMKV
jgi:hypothetical protein